jgi:Domain of Unknown Function (DUF928)
MNRLLIKIGFILVTSSVFSLAFYNFPLQLIVANSQPTTKVKFRLPPPPNRGINRGQRIGGASRVSNPVIDETSSPRPILVAFVPEYDTAGTKKIWGLAAAQHPDFWFYSSYSKSSINKAVFTFRNKNNQVIYKSTASIPTKPGIFRIQMPSSSPMLVVNQLYQWELTFLVTPDNAQDKTKIEEVTVAGWIQRTNLNSNLQNKIQQASPIQQAAIYADNGLWYDAFSAVAQFKRDRPQDVQIEQNWKDILNSVNLDKLANKPFVE